MTTTQRPNVTTIPNSSATTIAPVKAECRAETAPPGTDSYGVTHTGEKICTWGPELRSRLDGQGFLIPAMNHSVDLSMAADCWSAGGRVYLRTPASKGWACIKDSPMPLPRPLPALSASSTLTLRGLGPVRVGMTLSEASSAAGMDLVPERNASDSCSYAKPKGGPEGVSFMVVSGRVARVDITGGAVKTLSGAAVGDTEAAVQALYSGQLQVSPHKYVPAGRYLTLVPTGVDDAEFRLILETDGSKVTRFRAGKAPEVSFVEGCS